MKSSNSVSVESFKSLVKGNGFFFTCFPENNIAPVWANRKDAEEGKEPLFHASLFEGENPYVYIVPTSRGRRVIEDRLRKSAFESGAVFKLLFS